MECFYDTLSWSCQLDFTNHLTSRNVFYNNFNLGFTSSKLKDYFSRIIVDLQPISN